MGGPIGARRASSTRAHSRSTCTTGSRISASRSPVPSEMRSDSHCRSSTTRTSARLPAVSPTGRKSAPRKLARSAPIADATSSAVAVAVEPVGQGLARQRGMAAEFVVMTRRQEEQRRGNGERERDRPAEETLGNGTGGRAGGQHERSSASTRWPAATISLSTPENVTATREHEHRHHARATGWARPACRG